MPMHDWTRVEPGIYHAFHHQWVSAISNTLNSGLLPEDHYALPERQAAGFGPDILTLHAEPPADGGPPEAQPGEGGTTTQARPRTRFTVETDTEFYRRKKSTVVVRHVSGDEIIAMVEIVSPGNKASRHGIKAFVDKACEVLENRIHLLIVDPFPPGPRDPAGVHALIWGEYEDRPLTLASYECGLKTRGYIETIAVGEPLPSMPLYLEPDAYVQVPLEATYQTAFESMPRRWRSVLEAAPG